MASEGLIEITRRGRSESYSLTPAGIEFLAANEQYPGHDFKIKGDSLNALLRRAARPRHPKHTRPRLFRRGQPTSRALVFRRVPRTPA